MIDNNFLCRFGVVGEVWKRYISTVSVNTMTVGAPDAVELSIPPSFVEHETEQLRLGRFSKTKGNRLGDCCEGKNCVAYLLRGNNIALHPYLTPSQQLEFDAHGTIIEGPCLLDIRKTVTAIAMLYRNDCVGVSPHNVMPVRVPFYNRVNEPGGYNASEMIMPSDVRLPFAPTNQNSVVLLSIPLPGHVYAGSDGGLQPRKTPVCANED